MRPSHKLVESMVEIRQGMQSLNYRLSNNLTSSFSVKELLTTTKDINEPLRRLCFTLMNLKDPLFSKYFQSDAYLLDLLDRGQYQCLFESCIAYLINILQQQKTQQPTKSPQCEVVPQIIKPKSLHKLNQMIRDIVTPIRIDIQRETQMLTRIASQNNKCSQTLGYSVQELQRKHSSQCKLQQSLGLSSIQSQSPKFNEVSQAAQFDDKYSLDGSFNKDSNATKFNSNIQTQQTSELAQTPTRIQRKLNKVLLSEKKPESNRFPRKDIPKCMLSVDFVPKRRKTPEKYKNFDIITNS